MEIPEGFLTAWARYKEKFHELYVVDDYYDKWSECLDYKDVDFKNDEELFYAAAMLADDILPLHARKALGFTILEAMGEIQRKRYAVESLHLYPPKPGRKSDFHTTSYITMSVSNMIRSGMSATAAYREIAKELHKSESTIRRMYERAKKE